MNEEAGVYVIAFLACARAGLVHVPLNHHLRGAELDYLLAQSGARAVLVEDPEPRTPAGRVKEAGESPWRLELELLEPLEGVARGQAAVVYQPDPEGDIVLGSGTIRFTAKRAEPEGKR